MNNMNVSSSKFTFSIIAIAALVAIGSSYLSQEAYAGNGEASQVPTFIAVHNSTTTTEIIFQTQNIQHLNLDGSPILLAQRTGGVNGTGQLADWKVNGVVVTGITNGTAFPEASAAHYGGTAVAVFNKTSVIMLTHAALDDTTESTVQYLKTGEDGDIRSYAKISANDAFHEMAAATVTGIDQIPPTALSAKMIDAKRIQITMSEHIGNFNTTAQDFTLHGANTGGIIFGSIVANNGTNGSAGVNAGPADNNVIYLTTTSPIPSIASDMSISYGNAGASWEKGDGQNTWEPTSGLLSKFLTDDTHSYVYGCESMCAGVNSTASFHAGHWNTASFNHDHVGNRLANFTGLTLTNAIIGGDGVTTSNTPPAITASSVQVNSKMPQALSNDAPINIDVEVGDKVTFEFVVTNDDGSFYIPTASLYTNFIDRPDDMNLFYTNNFDSVTQESTSFYEWNIRSDDVAYDYSNTVSWNDASYTILDDSTMEITFSMEITNTMNPSQVWFQVGDTHYNFNNSQLPITLDVTGDELMSFESTGNQKLLGFLNESVLSTIVSGWTTSNDDLANVEQLSSALGVQDQVLPAWTTNLANWVVDEDIHAADMIVAVEYLINQ